METLSLKPTAWNDDIAEHLERALVCATRDDMRYQVENSGAQCYAICQGEDMVGAYMLRIDRTSQGPQGVIVAASGHVDGVELLDSVYPAIEKQLQDAGCGSIRVHTSRQGIAKMMGARGFNMAELVLTKGLQNV